MPDERAEAGLDILVIDDDPDVLATISKYLEARGHRVTGAGRGDEGLAALERQPVDIVVTDLKMPGLDGFEVLKGVREGWPETEVIMVTAFGEIASAVRAIKEGAFDFFTKPLKVEDLGASLNRAVRVQMLRRENRRYQDRLAQVDREARQRYGLHAIVGGSTAIREVRSLISRIAETDATTVLISGETGTGKELVARAIHVESRRSDGPFVAVDCSAIPPTLAESELYGHERGAFTDAKGTRKGYFEQADGGTLFLDEIGDMGLDMQAKLLRTLETRRLKRVGGQREIPVNIRIISASNGDLAGLISKRKFREDLFYRLNAFTIHIPPLRVRRDDILPIAEYHLAQYARRLRKQLSGFEQEAAALLVGHDFPGNIRELRNLVERAAIFCQGERIGLDDLRFDAPSSESAKPPDESRTFAGRDMGDIVARFTDAQLGLDRVEREMILEALRRADGNQVRAAKALGISRDALRRRIRRHGLRVGGGGTP